MSDSRQPTFVHCGRCGALVPVSPRSPYEFDVLCTCGEWITESWAHRHPPPRFDPDDNPQEAK